jgi:hypothetical protein
MSRLDTPLPARREIWRSRAVRSGLPLLGTIGRLGSVAVRLSYLA